MSLRSDIGVALDASAAFEYSEWGAPVLDGIPAKPAVMTRYGGRQIVNGFARHAIEVVVLYNMTKRADAYDGLEGAVDDLIDVLNGVDDCYPELQAVAALHDFEVVPRSKQKAVKVVNAYVGAVVRCVGAY